MHEKPHLAILCDAALQVVVQRVDVIMRRLECVHQAVRAERAPTGQEEGRVTDGLGRQLPLSAAGGTSGGSSTEDRSTPKGP